MFRARRFHFAVYVLVSLIAGGLLLARDAQAQHNEPKKAKVWRVELVRAYEECTDPNTITGGVLGLLACAPAVPSDTECSIDPQRGKGILKLIVDTNPPSDTGYSADVKIKVIITKLSPACVGEELRVVSKVRVTTGNCVGGGGNGCSVLDLSLPLADNLAAKCTVEPTGKCKINTTLNTANQDSELLPLGFGTGVELLECGVERVTGPGTAVRTFNCGLLIP
jgi:hypothetical protein